MRKVIRTALSVRMLRAYLVLVINKKTIVFVRPRGEDKRPAFQKLAMKLVGLVRLVQLPVLVWFLRLCNEHKSI